MRSRIVTGIVLAAALAAAGPARAQDAPVVGVGSHMMDARSLRYLKELGVRHARYTVYWNRWEAEPGYRRHATKEIQAAAGAGLELLVVVHGQPARYSYRNRHDAYRAYAAAVGELARTFPQVEAWELWNEMDLPGFTDLFGSRDLPTLRQRGRAYGEMLKLAYPAVKRANPKAIVVTGGISSDPAAGFVRGVLESGAPFDVLAVHAYGFPLWPALREHGEHARALLRDAPRPVWCTEFGMEEAVIPAGWARSRTAVDNWHLENWRDPIVGNEKARLYARLYGHVLIQGGDRSYDLVRRDGSLRPAAVWLRDHLR